MSQPGNRCDHHREQSKRMTIVVTHNTKAFESPNSMFDMHAHTCQLPIRFALLLCQFTAGRRAVWRLDTRRTPDTPSQLV